MTRVLIAAALFALLAAAVPACSLVDCDVRNHQCKPQRR